MVAVPNDTTSEETAMPSLSTARLFFDHIVAEGTTFLLSLVADKTPEAEWLDFKGGEHLDDDQIKVTWSRALCGFANNQGGVLVWGIDARFDKNSKVDAACDVKPVPDPNALRSRLVQLHPTATEPPLAGVDVRTFFQAGSQGPGFVVCYIPESDVKPHRAELLEGKPYMIRIGDSFRNPSPSILRNLFFPRTSARLGITIQPEWDEKTVGPTADSYPQQAEIRYKVIVRNTGLISVKDLFAIVATEPGACEFITSYKVEITDVRAGTGVSFPYTIHPSSSVPLCTIRQRTGVVNQISSSGSSQIPQFTNFKASFRLFVTDMRPLQIEVSLNETEVQFRQGKDGTPLIAE